MSYIKENSIENNPKFYKRKWFKILAIIVTIFIIGGGIFLWKTGSILNKISSGGLIQSLVHNIPGIQDELKGEKEGQVNILLLGMRDEGMIGGGGLADTIIMLSIRSIDNKISIVSIPRDLYVVVPGTQDKQKINAVYHYGEKKGKGQGLADMKTIVGEVTGLTIHYSASINFSGFKKLIDTIGGVKITLNEPFEEALQFNEPHVCDSFFNIPTGKYDNKTVKYFSKTSNIWKTRIVKSYPLCTAPKETLECGGDFKLPAGTQTLTADQALCYARSRYGSNDFERAKRQQEIIKATKNQMLSIGTLTDFSKITEILNGLGDNLRTDMQIWEMQKFYDLYKQIPDAKIYQKVLDNGDSGLLYHPEEGAAGYILLPKGDNYDKIHEMIKNIFNN